MVMERVKIVSKQQSEFITYLLGRERELLSLAEVRWYLLNIKPEVEYATHQTLVQPLLKQGLLSRVAHGVYQLNAELIKEQLEDGRYIIYLGERVKDAS